MNNIVFSKNISLPASVLIVKKKRIPISMGNRNSSARPSTASALFTSCCKCRTYSFDGTNNADVGHNGAGAPPAPNAVEMNERQPVAPGSDQPVDNQPSTENPLANPAESDKPEMFARVPRLPRPPRNPVGKSSLPLFSFLLMSMAEVNSVRLALYHVLSRLRRQFPLSAKPRQQQSYKNSFAIS